MRATKPLFRLDPGWLFIIAGLAVCAAGVLLPAQADLRSLEAQLALLQGEEARAYQRLAAHADFIDQVDRGDACMIKRLAAAQLNLVPEGDRPVLLAGGDASPVTEWIDATVDLDLRPSAIEPASTLSRWATGSSRLWMFGGGIMAVFIGLLIAPDGSRRAHRKSDDEPSWSCDDSAEIASHPPHRWHADDMDDDDDVYMLGSAADDAEFAMLAAAQADDEAEHLVDSLVATLPATADIDPDADLQQQEDTVDLEEDELPARTRSVIDDDVAWHNAAAVEHASELVIEAKEVAQPLVNAESASELLWEDDEITAGSVTPSISASHADVTVDTEDVEDSHAAIDADEWSIDDAARLSESSLLLPTADETSAPAGNVDDADDVAGKEGDHAAHEIVTPERSRQRRRRKRSLRTAAEHPVVATESADADSAAEPVAEVPDEEAEDPEPLQVSTPPKRRPVHAAVPSDDDAAATIPFLRNRAIEDGGSDVQSVANDEPSHSLDDEAPFESDDHNSRNS